MHGLAYVLLSSERYSSSLAAMFSSLSFSALSLASEGISLFSQALVISRQNVSTKNDFLGLFPPLNFSRSSCSKAALNVFRMAVQT